MEEEELTTVGEGAVGELESEEHADRSAINRRTIVFSYGLDLLVAVHKAF